MTLFLILGALIAFGLAIFIGIRLYQESQKQPGLGILFDYDDETGNVTVASRLLKSPAGYAGIPIGVVVTRFNDLNLSGASIETYNRFVRIIRALQAGDIVQLCYRDGSNVITMKTMWVELVDKEIPDYSNVSPVTPDERPYIESGIAVCKKTGVWIETRRLSGEAIRRALSPP